MDKNHHIWRIWGKTLHRWGLNDLLASFVEAAGPLSIIGAQLIYISQPILDGIVPDQHLTEITIVLENDDRRAEFVNYLREGV
jgi:hypothetical protein